MDAPLGMTARTIGFEIWKPLTVHNCLRHNGPGRVSRAEKENVVAPLHRPAFQNLRGGDSGEEYIRLGECQQPGSTRAWAPLGALSGSDKRFNCRSRSDRNTLLPMQACRHFPIPGRFPATRKPSVGIIHRDINGNEGELQGSYSPVAYQPYLKPSLTCSYTSSFLRQE